MQEYNFIHKLMKSVGVKRYIVMQSNRDVEVPIRCSIHSVSVTVPTLQHTNVYDSTFSNRPMELKIAKIDVRVDFSVSNWMQSNET
jgi:hypothetical protein